MNNQTRFYALGAMVCLSFLAGCATRPAGPGTYSFAMIGDLQYNKREEQLFPQLLDTISREPLAFVVHVGDFKAGSNAPCTDALFKLRREEFNRSLHALIYTPGDNEWVDCRRPTNGPMPPLARLDKLRDIFFNDSYSLGKNRIRVTRQSEMFLADPVLSRYRENAMWIHGGIVYATFNIQGSNDNAGFDAANDSEQRERTRANIEWLRVAMARAGGADIVGLVVFQQANPGFEEKPQQVAGSGFAVFLRAFETQAVTFGKPILFAHGDSHQHRIDRPYISPLDKRALPNITRVEGYGTPNVNWVRITVDATNRLSPFFIESGNFVPTPAGQ